MGRESWPLHSLTSSIFISLCLKKIHWCYQENQEEKCLAYVIHRASQVMQLVKNLPANALGARDVGSIPGSGRSPGIGNGNPLQYSCLENWKSHGQRSLVGYSPWGCKELDMTEHTQLYFIQSYFPRGNWPKLVSHTTHEHADSAIKGYDLQNAFCPFLFSLPPLKKRSDHLMLILYN